MGQPGYHPKQKLQEAVCIGVAGQKEFVKFKKNVPVLQVYWKASALLQTVTVVRRSVGRRQGSLFPGCVETQGVVRE